LGHADEDFPFAASFDVARFELVHPVRRFEEVLHQQELLETPVAAEDARPPDPLALGP
jgi:hypothetical protein